jgi:hypothetical protein
LTAAEIEWNCERAGQVLKELNAFIPKFWPLPYHLFRFFIAEIYWATRAGARKFTKLDAMAVPVFEKVPRSHAKSTAGMPRIETPVAKVGAGKKPHPSPRRAEPPAPAAVDPQAEMDRLLSIYSFMTRGHRKDRFIDVSDPSVLIQGIIEVFRRAESEHTFASLQSELADAAHRDVHLKNGIVFMTALAGSNNEFAASRAVVFFARRMMANGMPESKVSRPDSVQSSRHIHGRFGLFASVATQTPSMLQALVILRENAPKTPKGKRPGPLEYTSVGSQTETPQGPSTSRVATVSYPFGASAAGFAPSIRKVASITSRDWARPAPPLSCRKSD